MNNQTKQRIISAVYVFVFTFGFLIAYTIGHEYTHKAIAEANHCSAQISYFTHQGQIGTTEYYCLIGEGGMSQEDYRSFNQTQDMIDVFGYPLVVLGTVIVLLLSMIAFKDNNHGGD